ncbi:M14 family zinc carboxypeptidase [Neiella holothuriorum]|uniref:M14 family zinc carboxypeptidase n=1 Tax=Neiella holothuriorum TaxID=2870530 RepID=UPI001CECB5E8|nr:M14 family zinc carboxypeptidase [Neiella holothuriorum]
MPELFELEHLISRAGSDVRFRVLTEIPHQGQALPIHAIELGSRAPDAPSLGLIGGIHGVERIGTQVLLAYLHSLIMRLRWDESMAEQLKHIHLFIIPIANPGGMYLNQRANPNGVDLMRNAPIDATSHVPKLLGGHRLSRHLPWYRGKKQCPMQPELQALHDYMIQHLNKRPFTITLDMHSGFGFNDRLWFPYAGSVSPIRDLNVMYRINRLFAKTFPNHTLYKVEPQAHSYTTHGDIWDLLYDHNLQQQPQSTFMPLTLEMGSWLWVKKNPRQLLRYHRLFHPELPHRQSRILRRHYSLIDFLMMAARGHNNWMKTKPEQIAKDTRAALKLWYDGAAK